MKSLCLICKEPSKLTLEHIIPQSIGGRLQAKIYCKTCNEAIGHELDDELAEQFGWVGTLLNIKRARGKTRPYDVKDIKSGTTLVFDGKTLSRKKPIVEISSADGKNLDFADITARSEKELKEICTSIQKRYKLFGDMENFKDVHPGPTDADKEMTIDNALLRRAAAKIAYGLLCVKLPKDMILSSTFDAVRKYIKNDEEKSLAHANFVHTHFMTDHVRPLHKIHATLNRREKLIVGFVSLFGMFRFTVLIAEGFQSLLEWPGLVYTYDPVRGAEIIGKESFRAPQLTKENVLRPKQSKEFVGAELNSGMKVIETYVTKFKLISGEISS
ncbi:MAG: HNH endonuclease [Thermodesulfovibrionales bacterium]